MKTMREYEAYELYDELLDDVYGDIEVAGMYYATSQALKEIDPIAYQGGFSDWLNAEEIELDDD